MLASARIEHYQVPFLRADPDIDFAIRTNRQAPRVHFRWMHPAEILHCTGLRVETDQLRIGIRAGVKLPIFACIELPQVILRRRWFADHFDPFLWPLRIEAQDQRAIPRAKVNLLVRTSDHGPRARSSGCIELASFAGIGIDLDQEKQTAELVEIEV